jgi:predicted GIY-YIG superfamily endonuclease
MYFCYILECVDRSLSVGVTDNPARRLEEHNDSQGARLTAQRCPVRMVWMEEHKTLSSARQRENQLKGWSRAKKAALIEGSLRLRSGQGP